MASFQSVHISRAVVWADSQAWIWQIWISALALLTPSLSSTWILHMYSTATATSSNCFPNVIFGCRSTFTSNEVNGRNNAIRCAAGSGQLGLKTSGGCTTLWARSGRNSLTCGKGLDGYNFCFITSSYWVGCRSSSSACAKAQYAPYLHFPAWLNVSQYLVLKFTGWYAFPVPVKPASSGRYATSKGSLRRSTPLSWKQGHCNQSWRFSSVHTRVLNAERNLFTSMPRKPRHVHLWLTLWKEFSVLNWWSGKIGFRPSQNFGI